VFSDRNYVVLRIGQQLVKALVDSGSVFFPIIHERLDKQLNAQLEVVENVNSTTLISAKGSPLHVVAMTNLVVNMGGLHIPVSFKVVRNLNYQMNIGEDFFTRKWCCDRLSHWYSKHRR